jgi:hypothetical protein
VVLVAASKDSCGSVQVIGVRVFATLTPTVVNTHSLAVVVVMASVRVIVPEPADLCPGGVGQVRRAGIQPGPLLDHHPALLGHVERERRVGFAAGRQLPEREVPETAAPDVLFCTGPAVQPVGVVQVGVWTG